jgi:hypothetical protein
MIITFLLYQIFYENQVSHERYYLCPHKQLYDLL